MNHLDCPVCTGQATIDDDLTVVRCDACGVTVDVVADRPAAMLLALDEAA